MNLAARPIRPELPAGNHRCGLYSCADPASFGAAPDFSENRFGGNSPRGSPLSAVEIESVGRVPTLGDSLDYL